MEPITAILVVSALLSGVVAWKTLRPSASASPASASQEQQQVQAGGDALIQIGTQADTLRSQSQDATDATKTQFGKTMMTTAGGAATVGAGVAMSAAGTAASGALVAGVTFGIGAVVGIALVLWGKHEARIKGAKTENAGWNAIAAAWKYTITGIIDSYNKGQLTKDQAVAELQQLRALVLNSAEKFNHMPGVSWSGGGNTVIASSKVNTVGSSTQVLWSVKCDKHCTIGCCLYNGLIGPETNNAIALVQGKPVFLAGQNKMVLSKSFHVPDIGSTKYGFTGTSGFTLAVVR